MTVNELISAIDYHGNLFEFDHNYEVNLEGGCILQLDINWSSKYPDTVSSMIEKLSVYSDNPNISNIEIDIEDGYTYSEVIGVRLKVYDSKLTFIDSCYK